MAKKSSLTSTLKDIYVKTLPGMNNKAEDLEKQQVWVENAQNCRFEDEPGAVVKRSPITYYNDTTIGTDPIVGQFRHYGSSGNIKSIAIAGTKAYVGDDSAGTWTEIRASLTSGKRASFSTYKNLTIVSNGFDNPWVYDGADDNVTWELGSCKAVVGAGTGITRTSISYQVTINADAYICGAISNEIASTSNESIELTNIPLGPSGTTNRKIYRKSSETGGAYKLLATIADNTTTTYTDTTADASGGAAIGSVTDDMPKGSILKLHRERIFISGDPNNPNRIYYSDPYLPWYIRQTVGLDYLDIAPDDGDEIMGIPIQLGVMAVIKKNTIRRVHITSPTSGSDPSNWYAEDPATFVGTPAQWSIFETPHGVVFLGWNHWYVWNGSSATPIIDEFDTAEILRANYNDVVSYWLQEDILLAGYADATVATQYNNRVMRWNFKRNALSIDTINANTFVQHTGDDEDGSVYYGDSTQGFVYKAELSNFFYKLRTLTDADLGTKVSSYVGGTESAPYIEIGSITSANPISDDVCIFWDNASTNPGTSWTEITTLDGKFLKISTSSVGTTGEITVGSATESTVNIQKWRLFKKNNTTTLYQLPDGAIVMYDQPTTPTGFTQVGTDSYYIQIGSPTTTTASLPIGTGAGGTNIDQKLAFRFIKKTGEEDTWDGVSKKVYCLYYAAGAPGNDFTDVTSTYANDYLIVGSTGPTETDGTTTSVTDFIQLTGTTHTYSGGGTGTGANTIDGDTSTYYGHSGTDSATGSGGSFAASATVISEHQFAVARTITSITYRAYVSSTSSSSDDNAHYAYIYVQYATSADPATWVNFTGSPVSGGSSGSGTTTIGSTSASTTITQTVSDVLKVRIYVTTSGSFHNNSGSHSWDARIYELSSAGSFGTFATFRLVEKVLGKMQDYNNALTTNVTRGLYTSPGLEVDAESLLEFSWNEDKTDNDDVQIFTRTGSTQASVENGTSTTPDHTNDKFTNASHGLANGDRVQILASVFPSGIDSDRIYYVVGVSGNDWQVSLTAGGSAVSFSSNGTSVTYKEWSAALTNPNGSTITSTASTWLSYLIWFTATDSTVSNPRVYFADGFVTRFEYTKGSNNAEASVEFIYQFGLRNFDMPMVDKIFKKILSRHEGSQGQLLVQWETENSSGEFTVDLSTYPERWDSFFPSDAMGKEIDITFYKNDNYDFKLKEVMGLYTPEPIIV